MEFEDKLLRLKSIAKPFSILYIGDDKETKETFIGLLKDFFTHIETSSSLAEGLSLFNSNTIDIVFLDGELSDGDLFGTAKEMRSTIYDIPICIISSLQESDRLIQAIEMGINKYIFKPMNREKVVDVVYYMVNSLQNKKDAKELAYKKIDEKNIKVLNAVTGDFTHAIPFPMIVVNQKSVVFTNDSVERLFKEKKISWDKNVSIDDFESLFDLKDGYCNTLDELHDGRNLDKKFFYKYDDEIAIYIPTKKSLNLPSLEGESYIYVFNDVAPLLRQIQMVGYQRHKVDNYKALLEEILVKKALFNKEPLVSPNIMRESDSKGVDSLLDAKDIDILRKSHVHKVSAVDYIKEIDDSVCEEVRELRDMEDDIKDALYIFESSATKEHIQNIIHLLGRYISVFNMLIEFKDLANSISSVRGFLNELDDATLLTYKEKLYTYLNFITDDLSEWRKHVFQEQDTEDIHYLDSSLFSSILQLQLSISGQLEEEDNELELF